MIQIIRLSTNILRLFQRMNKPSSKVISLVLLAFVLLFHSQFGQAQRQKISVIQDTVYMESKGIKVHKGFYSNGNVKYIERTKDSVKEGLQEEYYQNGQLKSKIEYAKGNENGSFISYDYRGNLNEKKSYLYIAKQKKSVLNGPYKHFANGKLQLKTKYKKGEKQGNYKAYQNGVLTESSVYKNNFLIHQTKYFKNSKNKHYVSHFKVIEEDSTQKVVKHGEFIAYKNDGSIASKGNYSFGKKNGEFREYHHNSKYIRSINHYKDDLKFGPYKQYFYDGKLEKSGIIYETMDANGRNRKFNLHGNCIEYYSNGNLKSFADYDHGVKIGKWKTYYEEGGVKEEKQFVEGLEYGTSTYRDQNGLIAFETHYKIIEADSIKKSVKDGTEKRWKDGQLVSSEIWVNGKLHGNRIGYYPNGVLASSYSFVDGELSGKAVDYYKKGQLKSEREYKIITFNGSKKRIDYGLRKEYEEDGKCTSIYHYGPDGNPISTYTYSNGKILSYRLSNVIELLYLPDGALMSMTIHNHHSYNSFAQYFYINGQTRKIKFQNPNNGISTLVNYSYLGDYIIAYSDRHHNPDSLLPPRTLIDEVYNIIGSKRIENKFFTDSVKNGSYTLYYSNGKPMLEMEFYNDIPSGKFTNYHPLNNDTLWYRNYIDTIPKGYFVMKYANGNICRKGEYDANGNEKWYEAFEFNGIPVSKAIFNSKKEKIEFTDYHKNGMIKQYGNKKQQYDIAYYEDGTKERETKTVHDTTFSKSYFPKTGMVRSTIIYINNKRIESKDYWPNGKLEFHTSYTEGKRNGPFERYAESGELMMKGNFVDAVQDGIWLKQTDGVMDTLRYKNGKLVVAAPKIKCGCVDTAYSAGRLQFAPTLDNRIEFNDFIKYIPEYIKFNNKSSFESIFYTGNSPSYSRSHGQENMNLLMFDPISVNLPADEQVKITFNPCRTKGYISRMQIYCSFLLENPAINNITMHPNRITLELIKGPLVSTDRNYPHFTAFFNTEYIKINESEQFKIQLSKDTMPCFTSGTIKDFLHLDAKNGHPLIFEAPNNHSGRLSQIEISNFFGLAIDKGSVTFNYGKDSVNYQLMAEIESILAGGKYVYGQIYIPCKKIAPDIFQVSTRDEVIEISGQSLKVDWLKRGFTRLDIQYQLVKDNDKTEGELRIEFFVE